MAYLAALDGGLSRLLNLYASTVGALSPLLSLALLSAVAGIAMLWIIGKISNQDAVRLTRRQIQATLLDSASSGMSLRLSGDRRFACCVST